MVKVDGKTFTFLNSKVTWTVLYRRKRTQKYQWAIVGASLSDIMAKRNMKPEVRKAQREPTIKAAKKAKKVTQAAKKTTAPPTKVKAPPKTTRIGGKRCRCFDI
ncbi:unnamed protein product [Leptidea sinapis]|uniref:60S ribosomal protein L24 n=1 Tax=Leptidea sinapis TaxID=189913 RepID=A0A5E4QQ58_9NEOP|nr:unnamed protein product [Leptidea sinapis]